MWEHLEANPRILILFEFCPPLLRLSKYRGPGGLLARLRGLGLKFWRVGWDGSLTPSEPPQLLELYDATYADVLAARELP